MSEYSELVDRIRADLFELNCRIENRIQAPETFSSASNAARFLLDVRAASDGLEKFIKITGALHKTLKEVHVPAAFDADKVPNLTVTADGGEWRVTRVTMLRAGYLEGEKDKALAWLRANELGDIITEIMPPQSLAATAKALREENRDLPGDIFEVKNLNGMSITKVKP